MATSPAPQTSGAAPAQGVTRHANDKGIEKALGIGRNNKRLNTDSHDLQERMEEARDEFLEVRSCYIGRERHDFMRNGLLGEILQRTPIFVYDLPELKRICQTAFVDMSGKMYIADTFARRLLDEHDRGLDSLNFIFRHEGDHLRRLHLARMLDFHPEVANIAQDIRINIDITKGEAAERYSVKFSREASSSELRDSAKEYLNELSVTAVSIGCAMNIEDYDKYDGQSEEAIAALLMKEWKDAPTLPTRKVSFTLIMEGAAQESDNVKSLLQTGATLAPTPPQYALTPAELSQLAKDLRHVGQAKANPKHVSDADLQSCLDRLAKLREHQGLLELDTQHARASMALAGKGSVHLSGKTGDAYLDALKPSERVDLALAALDNILHPKPGSKGDPNGGIEMTDLERMLGRDRGNATEIPSPNVYHEHDHVMDTKDLVDTLKAAGVSEESLEKLGYDDLDKLGEEIGHAKDGVAAAINKATEDQMKVGSRYPGGHLLNYAKAQMLDFFTPILTWEMTVKKLMEAMGKGQRYDPLEAWTIYHVDAADMGYSHQDDVPFMGSMVPGRQVKPLLGCLYDTSGSVDDAMLKRFVSEGINMSRKMSRGGAPDVIHVSADTVARGDPIVITEKNYKGVLSQGFSYGGRGGTNFQASIENFFELVKPGSKLKEMRGRQIEALVYFTDTGDSPPDPKRLLQKAYECGMKKLPTIIFVAPKETYEDGFRKAIEGWASIVYYDNPLKNATRHHINLDKMACEQDSKMRGVEASGPSARRPGP